MHCNIYQPEDRIVKRRKTIYKTESVCAISFDCEICPFVYQKHAYIYILFLKNKTWIDLANI